MRIYGYGNRGMTFEDMLYHVHERYKAEGLGVMVKVPTEFKPIRNRQGQVISCKVEKKSCVDYLGRCGAIPVAAEAKSTVGDKIPFAHVEEHQAEFLDDWDIPGVISLVLVSFGMERFYAVPWVFWKAARDAWRKTSKQKVEVEAYGWTWTTPGMASVKAEHLLPDWEVKQEGTLLLPYMDIIKKMKGAKAR